MKKFAKDISNLNDIFYLECILQKCAVACCFTFEEFYTVDDGPEDWGKTLIKDAWGSERIMYKRKNFYVVRGNLGMAYIFYKGYVFHFDPYYTDCPKFKKIYKKYAE